MVDCRGRSRRTGRTGSTASGGAPPAGTQGKEVARRLGPASEWRSVVLGRSRHPHRGVGWRFDIRSDEPRPVHAPTHDPAVGGMARAGPTTRSTSRRPAAPTEGGRATSRKASPTRRAKSPGRATRNSPGPRYLTSSPEDASNQPAARQSVEHVAPRDTRRTAVVYSR